jgi:hypothetical protein
MWLGGPFGTFAIRRRWCFTALWLGLCVMLVPAIALAQTAGLVASYGFDEGSGTTVVDGSGNGNTGTISGAQWECALVQWC